MTFLSRQLATRAERLVLSMQRDEINTPGKLAGWLHSCAILPPALREWVFSSILPVCGSDGVRYLRELLETRMTASAGGCR